MRDHGAIEGTQEEKPMSDPLREPNPDRSRREWSRPEQPQETCDRARGRPAHAHRSQSATRRTIFPRV